MASLRQTHGRPLQERAAAGPEALSNPRNDPVLNKSAVHTQHVGDGAIQPQQVTRKFMKHVVVPVEEDVLVPVVRKEIRKTNGKQTIKCQRLVPVTKYKEVEETTLETRIETVNGKREKRAVPITQMRMQPYQDFEEQEYEMVIDVPIQEIVTRTGTRTDKQVVSRIVEVEQEHIYELRPVLVGKGETKHRHIGDHHKFKHEHGKPMWDKDVKAGWLGKPQTPSYKPNLHRPRSSSSVLGSRFDQERKLLHSSTTRLGSSYSGMGTARPGSGTRLPGTLQASASDPRLGTPMSQY